MCVWKLFYILFNTVDLIFLATCTYECAGFINCTKSIYHVISFIRCVHLCVSIYLSAMSKKTRDTNVHFQLWAYLKNLMWLNKTNRFFFNTKSLPPPHPHLYPYAVTPLPCCKKITWNLTFATLADMVNMHFREL